MNDQCNSKMDNQLWNDSIIPQSPVKNASVILQKQVAECNTLRTQNIAKRKNFGSDVFKELMVQYGLKMLIKSSRHYCTQFEFLSSPFSQLSTFHKQLFSSFFYPFLPCWLDFHP